MDAHQLLHEKMTFVNRNAIPKLSIFDGQCDCCKRSAEHFGSKAFLGKDGYGDSRNLCDKCCHLLLGDPEVLGYLSNKSVRSQTFSSMTSASAMIPVNGRAIFYPPEKTFHKIPPELRNFMDVVLIKSPTERIIHALSQISGDFIYIGDFGRKGEDLIRNLRVTKSLSELYDCKDSGIDTIDYTACLAIEKILSDENTKKQTEVIRSIERVATGQISPLQLNALAESDEIYRKVYSLLPIDPHIKINMKLVISTLLRMRLK